MPDWSSLGAGPAWDLGVADGLFSKLSCLKGDVSRNLLSSSQSDNFNPGLNRLGGLAMER
jgi:hypothetical protein